MSCPSYVCVSLFFADKISIQSGDIWKIKCSHFFTLLPPHRVEEKFLALRLFSRPVVCSIRFDSEEIAHPVLSFHNVEVVSVRLCQPVGPDHHHLLLLHHLHHLLLLSHLHLPPSLI